MGGGSWSANTYAASTGTKIASGSSFSYDRTTRSSGAYKAHETLDPSTKNAAGLNIREARDSVEHPNSVPIVITFDQTGSMGSIPSTVQTKLAGLMGLLTRQGYVEDPQVAIAAYGDAANNEYVPLQFSQFESDNRLDDSLDVLFLEGAGGGNLGETPNLAWYYTIAHTVTDAWEKRHKKGYYFMIADEVPLTITDIMVEKYIGDGEPIVDLKTEELAKKLQEQWDVYVLLIDNMTAKQQRSYKKYSDLFGSSHIIVVENPDTIAEVIGLTIGVGEGNLAGIEEAEADLVEVGVSVHDAQKALSAVKSLIKSNAGGKVVKGGVTLEVNDLDAAARI